MVTPYKRPDTLENRVIAHAVEHKLITREQIDDLASDDPSIKTRADVGFFIKDMVAREFLTATADGFRPGVLAKKRVGYQPVEMPVIKRVRPPNPGNSPDRERVAGGRFAPKKPSLEEVRGIVERVQGLRDEGCPIPDDLAEQVRVAIAVHGADDWRLWLPSVFPRVFTKPFGPHHAEFWDWTWSVERDVTPQAVVCLWSRDHAKSSSMEIAIIAMHARDARDYALFVSSTQTGASRHLRSMAALLESPEVAAVYPKLADREINKFGHSRGWNREQLRTASGLTVEAIGLDTFARGIRADDLRPDTLAFDDLDSATDTPYMTEKKIDIVTKTLLPASGDHCAVMGGQNMIHGKSMFARLARMEGAPEADWLADRKVIGPIPAIWNFEWAKSGDGDGYIITGGQASWEGMPLELCQQHLSKDGLTSFLVERQHSEAELGGGIFGDVDFDAITVSEAELPDFRYVCTWVDPAVTAKKNSDSCGIVIDALGSDNRFYRLWAWERVSTPLEVMMMAFRMSFAWGSHTLGVEVNQGGSLWEDSFKNALREIQETEGVPEGAHVPKYREVRAESGMRKVDRATTMLVGYETGKFRHLRGQVTALESGLRRFPEHKPFDCVDAAVYGFRDLMDHLPSQSKRFQVRAAKGAPVGDTKPSF